ncbi:hypothetical protein NA78x_002529 [Anatilimnocola sp. NA78]|uniref:hypothetical protein n=1 Tax=Anatilimnocola sp. NA78 TaxID=3415683 RepID=UPI003CE4911B
MTVHPAVRGVWSFLVGLVVVGGSGSVFAQDDLPPAIDSEGVETLTRGPVHEAFASPTAVDPAPGLIIGKQPPADIKEVPPEYQPEGDNVQWFPGYWSWDEDRDDFIWISGVWRDPPPGRRWVPGYWAEVMGGFQWVAGFWIAEQVEEMEYLKPPPESLEQGPSVVSPGDNYFYIPGSWAYVNNDYRWSAGYWAPYREEWVYVQPQWVWTPRGCIYVAGYYDYRLPRRGQIFAPVYFNPVVYHRPAYFYTPRCVINTSNLFVHLWVRNANCHYYFGNYYGPTYANRQFTPWCNYNSRPRCYDPLLSYCNVHYRGQGVNYSNRMQSWHKHYDNHANDRPSMTWKDQVARHSRDRDFHTRPAYLAQDLKDVVRTPDKHWKKQDLAQKDFNKGSIEQIKQLHKMRFDNEKVSLVSRDLPGRDGPGKDGGRDFPGRDNPGRDNPGRGPGRDNDGDNKKGPDLKLPGNARPGDRGNDNDKPDIKLPGRNPTEQLAGASDNLHGKIKLPKSTHIPNRPKVSVPETPDKTVVSRPNFDPSGNKPKIDLPGNKPKIGDLNVPGRNGRGPNSKLPGVNPPADTNVGSLPDVKSTDLNPLPGRDGDKSKKPNIGGTSAKTDLQERLNTIRQQQQDAVNKARNRGNDNPQPGNTQSGNTGIVPPNLSPTGRTPRIDTPKVDLPKTEVTRPPLSSDRPSFTPRSGGGGNTGGNAAQDRVKDLQNRLNNTNRSGNTSTPKPNITVPRVDPTPRSITPKVEPRSFTPPKVEPRMQKPTIERTSPSRPPISVQQRNGVPSRPTAPPSNPGNGNNDKGEKKRGR